MRLIAALALAVPCLLVAGVGSAAPTVSITLHWTAPGDDGVVGRAAAYELRYSTAPIHAANFAQATPVAGLAAPRAAGQPEQFTVPGLAVGPNYFFALRTRDEAFNWSSISNVIAMSSTTTGVEPGAAAFAFAPPTPNPVRSEAVFAFSLPGDAPLAVDVFDVNGRHVRALARGWRSAGASTLRWDLRDGDGRAVAPGLYLVRAAFGNESVRRRVVVAR